MNPEALQIRAYGSPELPTLIYLPGLHGNWMLIGGLRRRLGNRLRFVEVSYPSTLSWTIDDHASAIEAALAEHGIHEGWLLGESFSSQIVWPLVARGKFNVKGAILAGGFVRHPFQWGVRLAQKICKDLSFSFVARILLGYARVCRFRFRRSPETFSEIQQFVDGLTERDFAAAKHRLHLIAENDPCAIASENRVPVYALTGLFDPVVPWFWVRRWLKHNCPSLRAYRIICRADHNVLGSAPDAASEQILHWMGLLKDSKSQNPERIPQQSPELRGTSHPGIPAR